MTGIGIDLKSPGGAPTFENEVLEHNDSHHI